MGSLTSECMLPLPYSKSNAFHSISKGDRKENAFYSFNATVDLLMQGLPVTHQFNIEFVS